jgi:hypothetical protein
MRRLLPEPGTVTAVDVFDDVAFAELAPADRPYVVLNMVATADGAASVGNRTAPISNQADRQLFHELRAQVDAVMVATGGWCPTPSAGSDGPRAVSRPTRSRFW